MTNSNNNTFSDIIQQVNIVSIVSEYIDVSKKGKNSWAVCPFHQDTAPSLSISEEKQIFKCFACGVGGNAITFVRDFENISFVEAAKKVADIGGVKTNISISSYENKKPKWNKSQETILEINEKALNFFNLYLKSNKGLEAMQYLESRGIVEDIIEHFDLGLAPTENSIVKFLQSQDYEDITIANSGLAITPNDKLIDFFKNRIIFPVKDESGKVVAFSGRTFVKGDEYAKYKNTPETDVFVKGEVLYNFNNAKAEVARAKEIIVCEGFMDVIALYKTGFKNAIATMGTAFTNEHIKIIKGYTKNLTLFMDSDEAGQNATMKMAVGLLKNKINVKIVEPIDNLDVDDILEKHGVDKIKDLISNAPDFYQYIINNKLDKIDKNNIAQVSKFVKFITPIISLEKDETKVKVFKKVVLDKLGVELNNTQSLGRENKPIREANFEKRKVKSQYLFETFTREERMEYEVIKRMIKEKDAVDAFVLHLGYLPNKTRNLLTDFIVDFYNKNGEFKEAEFLNLIQDKASLFDEFNRVSLLEDGMEYNHKEMLGYIEEIKKSHIDVEIENLEKEIQSIDDVVEKAKILKEISRLIRKKGQRNE